MYFFARTLHLRSLWPTRLPSPTYVVCIHKSRGSGKLGAQDSSRCLLEEVAGVRFDSVRGLHPELPRGIQSRFLSYPFAIFCVRGTHQVEPGLLSGGLFESRHFSAVDVRRAAFWLFHLISRQKHVLARLRNLTQTRAESRPPGRTLTSNI